jgi:hypothetical protein
MIVFAIQLLKQILLQLLLKKAKKRPPVSYSATAGGWRHSPPMRALGRRQLGPIGAQFSPEGGDGERAREDGSPPPPPPPWFDSPQWPDRHRAVYVCT